MWQRCNCRKTYAQMRLRYLSGKRPGQTNFASNCRSEKKTLLPVQYIILSNIAQWSRKQRLFCTWLKAGVTVFQNVFRHSQTKHTGIRNAAPRTTFHTVTLVEAWIAPRTQLYAKNVNRWGRLPKLYVHHFSKNQFGAKSQLPHTKSGIVQFWKQGELNDIEIHGGIEERIWKVLKTRLEATCTINIPSPEGTLMAVRSDWFKSFFCLEIGAMCEGGIGETSWTSKDYIAVVADVNFT